MFANGLSLKRSIVYILMLIAAFIYPLFGKKNYYCHNICPCGSLQEIMGTISRKKWKIPPKLVQRLVQFRRILWLTLTILMLSGFAFLWMDYEIFTAFILTTASYIVIAQLVIVAFFSIFIPQAYCRFVCPTGTLFKLAQHSKSFGKGI